MLWMGVVASTLSGLEALEMFVTELEIFWVMLGLRLVRLGLTLVSSEMPERPELMLVWLRVLSRLIPAEFMTLISWPRLGIPLLILSEGTLAFRFELRALRVFKLGLIAARPELMLGMLRLSNGFEVVITFDVSDVRLVLNNDSGNPMFRPTPKAGVAGGRPIPVPDGFI